MNYRTRWWIDWVLVGIGIFCAVYLAFVDAPFYDAAAVWNHP